MNLFFYFCLKPAILIGVALGAFILWTERDADECDMGTFDDSVFNAHTEKETT